jgi:hypothetical protein
MMKVNFVFRRIIRTHREGSSLIRYSSIHYLFKRNREDIIIR